jgi:23S rRNA (adenine2030-N6)-methyltransferase
LVNAVAPIDGWRERGNGAEVNYRHAYHAGNHGDVLKHAVLARVLTYMTAKHKPMRLLDAHAGPGRYDLSGPQAFKTGEWQDGIGRLLSTEITSDLHVLLRPYLAIVEQLNPGGPLRCYGGSPEIAARLLREQDRAVFNELHPEDRAVLASHYGGDRRVKVTGLDAAQAIKAVLPFPERRGVVLIDPAFEAAGEWDRLLPMISRVVQRMAHAVVLAWYPFTGGGLPERLLAAARTLGLPRLLHLQLHVSEAHAQGGLSGSGLLVLNPPWPLENESRVMLPGLAKSLGKGKWGRSTVEWLTPP